MIIERKSMEIVKFDELENGELFNVEHMGQQVIYMKIPMCTYGALESNAVNVETGALARVDDTDVRLFRVHGRFVTDS